MSIYYPPCSHDIQIVEVLEPLVLLPDEKPFVTNVTICNECGEELGREKVVEGEIANWTAIVIEKYWQDDFGSNIV